MEHSAQTQELIDKKYWYQGTELVLEFDHSFRTWRFSGQHQMQRIPVKIDQH
jgi:tryptophan 2,3-dioxygenase